jgi:excisionase family DNA binding protein
LIGQVSILNDELLSVEEAAKRLKLNTEVMRRWLRTGRIVGHKVGRRWRISEQEILALTHGREQEEGEEEYPSCVCFPRWLEFSGLPGLITDKFGSACWNTLRSVIELDCQHNETPGKWIREDFHDFQLKTGLSATVLKNALQLLADNAYLKYRTFPESPEQGEFEIQLETPIKTPISVFEVDYRFGGMKNSNTKYTSESCVMRYL